MPRYEPVTIERAAAVNTRTGDRPAPATVGSVALVAPQSSAETEDNPGMVVTTGLVLYFPHGVATPDRPADRMRVRGLLYDVVGDLADWRSAYGTTLGGVVASLVRVTA